MTMNTSRRDFLKTTAAGAAVGTAFWVGNQPSVALSKSPNEKIQFACIGVEGRGSYDTDTAARSGVIVALCDIDEERLDKKARRYPDAKKYVDFRVMIEELGDKVDAVTVSTPDHTHATAAAFAMRRGKHAFVQKPLTWSVHEARVLREIANEKGLATQMGNQGTSENGLREAVEVVRSGAVGDVKEVHVWTNRPVWPQGEGRPTQTAEVPAGLHWDLFLGPAKERPYSPVYHPFKWRGWVDFGTGALGDMACHTANMAIMALDLYDPISVVAEHTGVVDMETFPKSSTITFEFAANENRGPVKMVWYDGGRRPSEELTQGEAVPSSGSLIVGEKGTLYSPNDYGASYVLLPREKFTDYKKPEQSLPRSNGDHFGEFARAIAGGPPAMSNFNYASRLTETILLGNAALLVDKKLEWNAKEGKFNNAPEANQYLHREYREGWTL